MKRRLSCLILALLLLISLSVSAMAAAFHIDDSAMLLNKSEIRRLEDQAEEITEEYSIDIVIVTVDTLGDKYASYYAERYYDENSFDMDGILLLIAMEEREWYILTNGKCDEVFSSRNLDRLEEAMLDDLSDGDYYRAFSAYLEEVSKCMRNAGRVDTESNIQWGISLIVGAVVAAVVVLIMLSQMKTAKPQSHAIGYIRDDTYRITEQRDMFLYSRITKTPKPQNNGSSGHRSGGGGGSRGGRGGRF